MGGELHVAIASIVLDHDFRVRTEAAESGTVHVIFTRTTDGTAVTEPWRPGGPTI